MIRFSTFFSIQLGNEEERVDGLQDVWRLTHQIELYRDLSTLSSWIFDLE